MTKTNEIILGQCLRTLPLGYDLSRSIYTLLKFTLFQREFKERRVMGKDQKNRDGEIRTHDLLHPKQALWTKLSHTP